MANINVNQIASVLKHKIDAVAQSSPELKAEGVILSIYDGVCIVYGLKEAVYGEMVRFANGTYGLVLNLEADTVGILAIAGLDGLSEGDKVYCTGKVLSVPVGEGFLGRVVDPLGNPLDGKGPIQASGELPIERVAPGVMTRQSVSQPILTGYKAIDSMVPIGRGQRELIIGDRQTGKTALAIDTIINQKGSGVFCIYVAIGQKQSTVVNIVEKLREHGVLDNTIVMSGSASSPAAMQYISAYSGCAMGEYFRDSGRDALIIYDDLSKHAVAYRQISLLLKRPPGREAYPGDIFYLHSRLLERAARVNTEYVEEATQGRVTGRTGSLTALPIIETQGGDFSAFVPTNVVSITDGQIFTNADLFNGGSRPAVDSGLSVSRVGGAAQHPIIKKLGGGIRLALAQYREIAAFSQFASDLDDTTKKQLDLGEKMVELMKQEQYAPLCTADMALLLFASNNGYLDAIPVAKIKLYEKELLSYFEVNHKDFRNEINNNPVYNKEVEENFYSILKKFNSKFE